MKLIAMARACHRIIAAIDVFAGFILSTALPQVTQNTIIQPIASDMEAVNAVIRRQLHSDVPLVNQIAEYIISAGGKRIRPVLVLLAANAYGYRGTHHHQL